MKNIFARTKIFSCSAPRAAEELDAGGRGGQPGVPAAAGAGGEGDEEQQARGGRHLPHQVRTFTEDTVMISTVNTVFARAAQIHPDNVVVRTLRGKALLMCGQYEAALEVGSERRCR